MVLRDVIEVLVGLLVGAGVVLLVVTLLAVVLVGVDQLSAKLRERMSGNQSLQLEQYRAERDLHSIRRRAIRDMLETSRAHHAACEDDVIEGTAIEVGRR